MNMKKMNIKIFFVGLAFLMSSCISLDRKPLTEPSNADFLSGETQVRGYINGLYLPLPSYQRFGMSVRGEEKNSDNIVSLEYDKRLNGENNGDEGTSTWLRAYSNLRSVNYFFHYYKVPEAVETDEIRSYKGEAYFLRAYWHFYLLKNFGSIPLMTDLWDDRATIDGLQIPQSPRNEAAKQILSDLDMAIELLYSRNRYNGLRINKETAMLMAMRVALFEGSWEKYHSEDVFASPVNESEYFFREVMKYGDMLFKQGISLNTEGQNPGDAFGSMFNRKDYTNVPEALFWRVYSNTQGVSHALTGLLASGVIDTGSPAGVTGELVNTYLYADGTPINPTDEKFKDFNETFKERDARLTETVMSSGAKFKSTSDGGHPMEVVELGGEVTTAYPPYIAGDGNSRNITGYHIRLGVDTTYVRGESDVAYVMFRYSEALLSYAEAAEELGLCNDEVLNKTLKPLRERAGVKYLKPTSIDPYFTDYGYPLTPNMQEIRRERRVELALQGYRLDDILRWAGAKVIIGKRGKGAYFGKDGVLYKSFPADKQEYINLIPLDPQGFMDPLQEYLRAGYQFRADRDYLLAIPSVDVSLNKELKQNPNWN